MPPARYTLEDVQRLVRRGDYRITVSARIGASDLYLDESDILDCVLLLEKRHFYKTMPASKAPGLHQDVYRLRYQSRSIYLKLQVNRSGAAVVVSFKRDDGLPGGGGRYNHD